MPQLSLLQFGFTKAPQRIKLDDQCWYIRSIVPDAQVPDFAALWQLHPEELGVIKIHGHPVSTPCYIQSYGEDYYFSGELHKGQPVPDILNPLLSWARATFHRNFNQVLVNWYENESHYIGCHSDDMRNLVEDSPIVSISFGASCNFRIRGKHTTFRTDIVLEHKSVIVMGGKMQMYYTHEITKATVPTGPRINITFREMKKPVQGTKRKIVE
ncbi:hypothetical protein BC937DRAFT_93464 [Endogone sp. FLAS-F59071]|nr:hypothetical protein BC937DRAFT_93464 [Endogone sp. FLAS-F59071]|eukprot:RUS14696.1 hypothetical protein BC937DRAFT_93464 [Endogone sp. FLAS-F59071]